MHERHKVVQSYFQRWDRLLYRFVYNNSHGLYCKLIYDNVIGYKNKLFHLKTFPSFIFVSIFNSIHYKVWKLWYSKTFPFFGLFWKLWRRKTFPCVCPCLPEINHLIHARNFAMIHLTNTYILLTYINPPNSARFSYIITFTTVYYRWQWTFILILNKG